MNQSTTQNVLQGVVIGLTISAVVGFAGWWYYTNYIAPKLTGGGAAATLLNAL